MSAPGALEGEMPPTFKKMTFREARNILNNLCLNLDGKEASSNKNVSESLNPDGAQESWWVENNETCPAFENPRCKAYLRAYIEIAGTVRIASDVPVLIAGFFARGARASIRSIRFSGASSGSECKQ
jgi:hypothetical protein